MPLAFKSRGYLTVGTFQIDLHNGPGSGFEPIKKAYAYTQKHNAGMMLLKVVLSLSYHLKEFQIQIGTNILLLLSNNSISTMYSFNISQTPEKNHTWFDIKFWS